MCRWMMIAGIPTYSRIWGGKGPTVGKCDTLITRPRIASRRAKTIKPESRYPSHADAGDGYLLSGGQRNTMAARGEGEVTSPKATLKMDLLVDSGDLVGVGPAR